MLLVEQNSEKSDVASGLLSMQQLLHDSRKKGGSAQAIHATYIDWYGAFTLEQPRWLATVIQQVTQLSHKTSSKRSLARRYLLLQRAAARVQRENPDSTELYAECQFFLADILKEYPATNYQHYDAAIASYETACEIYTLPYYPRRFAAIQYTLGNAYYGRLRGDYRTNQEQALSSYREALRVYTPQMFPMEWARTLNNLGTILHKRLAGDQSENLEQALASYRQILQIYTESEFPSEWAATQNNLSVAYYDRIAGERRFNLEEAIACATAALRVYQREVFPDDWAWTLINLGNAYSERLLGEQHENQERAIAYYTSALEVYTYTAFSADWAMLQHNLGNIYRERIEGDHRANLEQAILHYQAALRVYTPDDFPLEWSGVQNGLGNVFHERVEGERRVNQEQAIAHFHAALQIRVRQKFPHEWAITCQNLGVAYSRRIEGERRTNLEQALLCYRNALEVHTRTAYPIDWAMLQQNLGNTYLFRIEGEQRENIEQSIAACQASFEVYSREAFPVDWASTHYTLSNAYSHRIEGERYTNLEMAIAACHAALLIYTREAFAADWAQTHQSLGTIYGERIRGERRANLEQSITCYEAALQVYTYESFPVEWAMTQHNLGNAWLFRVLGKRSENLERALGCYQKALQVYTYTSSAEDWARTTHALGNAYLARILGDRRENLEQALICYTRSSQIYTRSAFPLEWARLHEDKGNVYLYRIADERKENLECAVDSYQAALQIYTRETFPEDWARTLQNLGVVYSERLVGQRQINQQQAVDCFQAALQIYTLEAFPDQHRRTQLNFVPIAAAQGHWDAVEHACAQGLAAEDLLVRLGSGATGRDVILKQGRNLSTQYAFALMRQGKIEQALLAIERGRTRGLTEALMLGMTDPEQISDIGIRSRFHETRQRFIEAQSALNLPFSPTITEQEQRHLLLERTATYHQALTDFDTVVIEIRTAQHLPDFLIDKLDPQAILDIAASQGPGHALVYLAATPWGGMALAALAPSSGEQASEPYFAVLELPALSQSVVDDLLEMILDDGDPTIIGGFLHAQENHGIDWIVQQWSDTTFRGRATALHLACEGAKKTSMLDMAAQTLLASPLLAHLVDCPLEQVDPARMEELASTLEHTFLQLELQRCLTILSDSAMYPLVTWLSQSSTQRLTLIPCGSLATFPLAAAFLTNGHTVAETLSTCIALSARSLLPAQREEKPRAGVYTLGDPHPTHQPLHWGEAEALTLAKLARILGWQGEAKVQYQARRSWAIQALQHGLIVDVSCHGTFNSNDFLQSALLFANGQRLTLAEMLNREVDMHGLRLLILSACQTAILDLRGASNEVRSLTAGMIQAGVRAVLASLWSVDDRATYLLIVRFAQEWFPKMTEELPSAALARAQHWLRNVTNDELQHWEATSLPPLTIQEQQAAGAQYLEHDQGHAVLLSPLAVMRGRGTRYELQEAESLLHSAVKASNPTSRPYENPVYWAGFQIIGW